MSNIGILLTHFLPGWAGWSFRGVTICVAFVVGQVPVPLARNFVSLLVYLPGISPRMEKARLRSGIALPTIFRTPPPVPKKFEEFPQRCLIIESDFSNRCSHLHATRSHHSMLSNQSATIFLSPIWLQSHCKRQHGSWC
jgi:hypothetical protein